MLETDLAGVGHLDGNLAEGGPVGVQAGRQDVAEPAFHPYQRPLVVLQVQYHGVVLQRARLDDHIELLVGQPRGALRDDLHFHLAQRVEEPVPTSAEQALELAVAEVQANFIAANLDHLEHLSPSFLRPVVGRSCFTSTSCQATPLGGGTIGDHTDKCGVSFEHPRSHQRHGSFRPACRRQGEPRRELPNIHCRLPKAGESGIHALHGTWPCCHRTGFASLGVDSFGYCPMSSVPEILAAAGRSQAGGRSHIGPPPSGRLEQGVSLRCWYGSRTRDSQISGLVL